MPKVSTGIDEETYQALLVDAARYLRPAERHIAALLRQALGLPVPLPLCEAGMTCEDNHRLVDEGKVAEVGVLLIGKPNHPPTSPESLASPGESPKS